MGFGSKKQKTQQIRTPNYNDPFGQVRVKGNNIRYNPAMSDASRSALSNADSGQNTAVNELNQFGDSGFLKQRLNALPAFDLDSYYNNPFYEITRGLYARPIEAQYDRDQRNLTNNLNARGLVGGSYDALMNSELDRNRNSQLAGAEDKARLASADAYNTSFNNQLAGFNAGQQYQQSILQRLLGLGQFRQGVLGQIYTPLQMYAGLAGPMLQGQISNNQLALNQQQQQNSMLSTLLSAAGTIGGAAIGGPAGAAVGGAAGAGAGSLFNV